MRAAPRRAYHVISSIKTKRDAPRAKRAAKRVAERKRTSTRASTFEQTNCLIACLYWLREVDTKDDHTTPHESRHIIILIQ